LIGKAPKVLEQSSLFMDAFERLLWWLFAGSTGAQTRFQVLNAVREQPRNAQQLSQALSLDYTTIRHHLGVLEKNRLVLTEGDKYGKLYFLSELMEANWGKLETITRKISDGNADSKKNNRTEQK
jgi:DNA-binding transcriptional ArsR family regulator